MKRNVRGASLIIVLVVLAVLLLGAVSMARLNDTTTQIAGNVAYKDTAVQASEIGVSNAFANLANITDEETSQDGWYLATLKGDDATGLPIDVDWTLAAKEVVGSFTVRYIVERQCVGPTPVLDINAQCVIKKLKLPSVNSAKAGMESIEMAAAKQYRITVFVSGPKFTKSYVQTMVVR